MYDIKPLEEQWKAYHRKKRRPFYFAIIFILFLLIGIYFFIDNKGSILEGRKSNAEEKNDAMKKHKEQVKLIINDSLDKLETNTIEIAQAIENPIEAVEDIPILEEEKINDSEQKKSTSVKKNSVRKRMHLNIIETSNVSAYRDVEKRFYQSHDIDDALFLAKAYFRKGDYKKAEYWALQTNKVDKNIDESWIIFVKSKVKQGRKNEAISILESYVKKSHSKEAKNLLSKLKR